ncbi:MAG: hypothetical protein CK425_06905 [Parachlamydia sp.]|nr:MAG: hypothetical protein CK425_06905 [Parachlamydia sp.]
MIKRIDLFIPYRSLYGVLNAFTDDFAEALSRQGVICRVLEANRDNPQPFLDQLFRDPPDCTLSFNGLLPDEEGRFFCDLIQIPHVACLVDAPTHFLPLANSPLTIITTVDRSSQTFFHEIEHPQTFFMPHGVDKDFKDIHAARKYSVVMLSSCIDYEAIHSNWQERFAPPLVEALNEAATVALSPKRTSYMHAFVQAIDKQAKLGRTIDPQLNFVEALDMLERYIRGKDRVEMVRSIKNAPVDVFGTDDGTKKWSDFFKDQPNVRCHPQVRYEEALQIMQQTKILLSSCAWISDGLHERIPAGTQAGALVVCQENPYLLENFPQDQSLLFYTHGAWDKLNDQVDYYLGHEQERKNRVEAGKTLVQQNHTWDHRARQLLQELNVILATEH